MGERHETDLVRLAAEAGEKLFPAHRIDKVTSGALLFAKELRWHGALTRQFAGARWTRSTWPSPAHRPARPRHHRPAAQHRAQEPGPGGRQPRPHRRSTRPAARWSVPADESLPGTCGPTRRSPPLPPWAGPAAHAARRPPGHRPPAPDPGSPGLDRPSDRGRPAVRVRPAPAGPCCTRGGWGSTPPGRGGARVQAEAPPGARLLGAAARPRPAARLGRHP